MGELIKFPKSEVVDREELAGFLEKYAAKARAGEIDAIAFAMIRSDGSIGVRWCSLEDFDDYLIVSATAYLHHRVLHSGEDCLKYWFWLSVDNC